MRRHIGDLLENLESQEGFEINTLLEDLNELSTNPLDLNKATQADLQAFVLLTPLQVSNLIFYRKNYGKLVRIEELQVVPAFDSETIQKIIPFVSVKPAAITSSTNLQSILQEGSHTLFFGGSRTLEERKGYQRDDGGYAGTPWREYARYRFNYNNRISVGITLESDPGEPFFNHGRISDYASFHLFGKNISKTIQAIALGDYDINLGQGLIMYNGFSPGKSANSLDFKRSGTTIRPHTSVEEVRFHRGLAATLNFSEHWEATGFISSRNRDGNLISLSTDTIYDAVSSLQTSGLHRTPNEMEDRGAVHSFLAGGKLKYHGSYGHIAVNFYNNFFDFPLRRKVHLYNQFLWNGDQLGVYSLDYSYRFKALTFFGESAYSNNGGYANTHSILMGLSEFVSAGISYRNFDRRYSTLYPGSFSESATTNNENGLYLALDIHPNYHWIIRGYIDLFNYPWLKFGVDAPSEGREYLIRASYRVKRKLEAYVQWKEETKFRNFSGNETPIDFLVPNEKTNLRAHISWKVNPSLELRSRAELVWWDERLKTNSKGFLVFQDILFKSISLPFSFRARYAWFKTDDYDSRIYTYENDLIYNFSIPAFADHGSRYYINLRYDISTMLTAEARFAQTYYRNRDTISNGNEQIEGNKRSDIKFQIRLRF